MKAIILAAGKGTRVRPLTYDLPKPMIPILHKPVMELLVELLAQHGVRQLMVNTSYMAPTIENYFRDGSRFGVEMAYSFEGRVEDGKLTDEPVGSAGAIRRIQDHSGFFDETFVVLCGDAVIDLDLTALLEFHRAKKAAVTIALAEVPRDQVSSYGVVVRDETDRIIEFQEKPSVEAAKSTTVNTGIYIFEPAVIELIPPGMTFDIGGELFPQLVEMGAPIYGVTLPFQWLDIGQLADYYRVSQMALRGEIERLPMPGKEIAPGVWTGLNVNCDWTQTDIVPPVYIGGSATIEPGSTIIGPTMIGSGCKVESGAHVEKSVVFDYTRIGCSANVKNMFISGQYGVDSEGTVVDFSDCEVDWVIADSRSTKKVLKGEQADILHTLQRW